MSTIDDLRSTLDDHAPAVDDPGAHAPPGRGARTGPRRTSPPRAAAGAAAWRSLAGVGPGACCPPCAAVAGRRRPAPRTAGGPRRPGPGQGPGPRLPYADARVPPGEVRWPGPRCPAPSWPGRLAGRPAGSATGWPRCAVGPRRGARPWATGRCSAPVPLPGGGQSSFTVLLDDAGTDAEVGARGLRPDRDGAGWCRRPAGPAGPVVVPGRRWPAEAMLGATFAAGAAPSDRS